MIEGRILLSQIAKLRGGEEEEMDLDTKGPGEEGDELPQGPFARIRICEHPEIQVALTGVAAIGPGSIDADPVRPLRQGYVGHQSVQVQENLHRTGERSIGAPVDATVAGEEAIPGEDREITGDQGFRSARGARDILNCRGWPCEDVPEDGNPGPCFEDLGEHS